MSRGIERQNQQWPHRVAALSAVARQGEEALHLRVRIAMPMPTNLQLSGDQPDYGGSHGMKVYQDHQGDWSLKQPKPSLSFTVPLEAAAANLQRSMGLEAPESYVINHQGRPAVVSKWYPNSTQAFQKPPRLHELHPDDQMEIQKNHALDWLIGNHDSHVGNWMRTQDGKLVSIDKGQAGKYFGHDRLDPQFHPNYYAREPIYNQLWRDHAAGRGQMHDPRTGELGAFVQQVQSIPDEKLKGMFRDYAHSAAQSGLLLNPDGDPSRNLGPRTVPANDPEAFLNALVERKNNLHKDLGDYYDRMSGSRREFVGARGDRMPRHEEWMYDYDEDTDDLQRSQLEMEPWQRGEYPRPEFGNEDPNFVTNNGYIRYHPDKVPGTLWQGDGKQRGWWQETPESLANWQEQVQRKPGPGQMDLFSGEEVPSLPDHPDYDEWRVHNSPRRPRTAAPGKARGERLYLPGDVADHLGVPRQTLMSWIYNKETPSPTHTSKPHKEMWDNLDVWDRWHAKREDIERGPRGYPEGWAAEFQTRKNPQRMLTIPDIAQQTGMSLSDVYKSVYRPQDSSAKLPRNTHFAVGDDNRGVHFWESLRPSSGKRETQR